MAADPTSPVAPASVRILLIPVGTIKSSRFATFVERLRPEIQVRLGDISPDAEKTAFSPLAFPSGVIFYNFTTALPLPSHLALSPFETFREPLIVICIGDGLEYSEHTLSLDGKHSDLTGLQSDLQNGLDKAREQNPRALVLQVLLFDYVASDTQLGLPAGTVIVPKLAESRSTTMKTIMADISSHFLAELSTLARSIQIAPPLDLLYNAAHGLSTSQFPLSGRSAEPLRSSSLRTEVLRTMSPALNGTSGDTVESASRSSSPSIPAAGPTFNNVRHSPPVSSASSPPRSSVSSQNATNEDHRDSGFEPESYPDVLESDMRSSHEQKSTHRTSQGTTGEFANSRLKGRQAVIIGTFYLQSGRWPDALRELVDGATRARVHNDHMWYAKGLENILVTMMLLAWAGLDFQIPSICLAVPTKSSKRVSSGNFPGFGDVRPSTDATNDSALQRLSTATNGLSTLISNNYSLAANAQGELPFQFAFSESIIRLAKLLSVQHLVGDTLNHAALQYLVRGTSLPSANRLTYAASEKLFKGQLSAFLFRAYPPKNSTLGLSVADRVVILAGIASVLSLAGLQRKRAIVNKQLLSTLVPALINARKIGAAEAGIYPAASMAVLQGSDPSSSLSEHVGAHSGFLDLLKDVCYAYGVHGRAAISASPQSKAGGKKSTDELLLEILNDSDSYSYGSYHMRTDILRLCTGVSEALPDFRGIVHYAAALLCAGEPRGVPLNGALSRTKHSRDEQIELSDRVTRTLTFIGPTRALSFETTYWDQFLVRGIELQPVSKEYALLERSRRDFAIATVQNAVTSPFLHNAISKTSTDVAADRTLVTGERAEFTIWLQNPHEFDIVIEKLLLSTEGVPFDQKPLSIVLSPRRMQQVVLNGRPQGAGQLQICGCDIKVQGCREQQFLIFDKAWSPVRDLKVKSHSVLGPSSALFPPITFNPTLPGSSIPANNMTVPHPATPLFSVAEQKPLLSIVSTSLPQSMIAILHGEMFTFSITVRNMSSSIDIDFVNLSFTYSGPRSSPLISGEYGTETELYDAEYESIHQPPFRWRQRKNTTSICISPGHSTALDIEVLGKQNLSECIVLVEYAYLGCPIEEAEGKFFTRLCILPLTVTVNPSIQLERVDIVALESIAILKDDRRPSMAVPIMLDDQAIGNIDANDDEMMLILLDMRNSWLRPLAMSLQNAGRLATSQVTEIADRRSRTVDSIIQPGHVARFVIPLTKVSGTDFDKAIPVLNPTSRRQFVVNVAHESSKDEKVTRQAFWCREEILKQIHASWTDVGGDRCGSVDLRGLELSPPMVAVARQSPLHVQTDIFGSSGGIARLKELRKGKFTTSIDEFLTFKVTLRNRTEKEVQPYVRVQPGLLNKSHDAELDLGKCMAWTGSLQRPAPRLKSGQGIQLAFGLCFLSIGSYEIIVDVDDLRQVPTSAVREDRERQASTNIGRSVCTVIAMQG